MAKKKKTLKQKKLADQRIFKEVHEEIAPSPITPSTFSYAFTKSAPKTIAQTYSLQHDIRKTLLLSATILFFLFLLSTLLRSHAFMLPLVSLRY